MKKYAIAAILFLFNSEVISWIALLVICVMALGSFFNEVHKAGGFK